MISLKKEALSSLIWAGAQQFGAIGVNFIVGIFLARILDPSVFGVVAMIAVIRSMANALINSGMSSSLIRTNDLDEEDYSTVFLMNMLISLMLYVVVFFGAPFIAEFYETPILTDVTRVLCITFIIQAVSIVQSTRLTKELNFRRIFIIRLPSIVISGGFGVFFAYSGFGVWSLVYMNIIQSTLYTIQLFFYSKWLPAFSFNLVKFKKHFSYGLNLTLSSVIGSFLDNLYLIVIGKYFSLSQVGFYSRAESLKKLPVSSISDLLVKVTFPLFSKIQGDVIRLKQAYRKLIQMVLYLLIPLIVLMAVLAEPLFSFILTDKWLPAVPYFQIMCITAVLYPLHSYNLNILKVMGRSDLFLKLEVVKRTLVLISVIVSLPFGILGLLYGQIVVNIIALYLNTFYSAGLINYSIIQQIKDNLKILLVGLLFLVVMIFIFTYLKTLILSDIALLGASSIIGVIVYWGLSVFIKVEQLQELYGLLKQKR